MNKGSDSILSVYSDARAEYTKQLCSFLVPAYFQFYIDLLEKAKQTMINEPKKALWQFQNYLNDVHDWNNEKVNNEIHIILVNSGCDYLEDLLTAVFIAHTKVLTAIRLSTNNKKIDIKIPKVEHFLFKALCETSKILWSSTYLFRDGIPGIEKQQNYRTIEGLLNEGIIQAVRNLVPVKTILKDFMFGSESANDAPLEEESDEEEETEVENKPKEEPVVKEPVPVLEEVDKKEPVESILPSITETVSTPTSLPIPPTPTTTPTITPSQTILLDQKPTVQFGQFNAVFNLDEPDHSDMVHTDPDESVYDDDQVAEIEISPEEGIPLAEAMDYEDLNAPEKVQEFISADEYEEL
jgi:hypothetical protein